FEGVFMSTVLELPETAAIDLARETLYRFLAALVRDPRTAGGWGLLDPDSRHFACQAADVVRTEACAKSGRLGFGELSPEVLTLEPVCVLLEAAPDRLGAEFDRAFGVGTARGGPPFETEYHVNADPFFRAQQMADVAGFYRAFGLQPSQAWPERPDHLAFELEFMAFLLLKKRLAAMVADLDPKAAAHAAVCAEAEQSFFRDHLAWWLPAFARRRGGTGLWGRCWARSSRRSGAGSASTRRRCRCSRRRPRGPRSRWSAPAAPRAFDPCRREAGAG